MRREIVGTTRSPQRVKSQNISEKENKKRSIVVSRRRFDRFRLLYTQNLADEGSENCICFLNILLYYECEKDKF